jgi:hypothetical protein
MQQLKRSKTSIKNNYLQLTMHALVLTLNLTPVIIDSLPFKWLTSFEWSIVEIILIVTETITNCVYATSA